MGEEPRAGGQEAGIGLAEMQHWTRVLGRAQQLLMEHAAEQADGVRGLMPTLSALPAFDLPPPDAQAIARAQAGLFAEAGELWRHFLDPQGAAPSRHAAAAARDRRFAGEAWGENPLFDLIRQTYLLAAEHLFAGVDSLEGVSDKQREKLRFATRAMIEALSPANFAGTNPEVLARVAETRGASLIKGIEHLLADLRRGQLTHVAPGAFEVGRNIATTPGKVIHETPLYQLIHYAPTTPTVFETPIVIFPPWINRFYILDLNPQKSFVRWAVEQGFSVFMVSWKSADASLAETRFDDYVVRGQVDAIDTVRTLLGVPAVHAVGYCVAGTTLATMLAWAAARGQADRVASATFFTAQVDFSDAGELGHFIDDAQLGLIEAMGKGDGYLDGRYMAAAFNLLRGRDLIWNYVVNHYLLGDDYPAFDLLHWNGDTTNLPARWHMDYLRDLYRDNKLVQPGAISIDGTPIDLGRVETPAYVQAGREDHIAPPQSVWKLTEHLRGPLRFVLAGSGHIAGVVNPPASGKYQYWTSDHAADTLDAFIAQATETKGSWWPDWRAWLEPRSGAQVAADGARQPGQGALPAIEDAPGRYVRTR